MFRKYFTIMLVVLSLCSTMRLCYADYDSLQNNTTIEDEERELGNRKDDTDRFKNEYNKIHGQVKELIGAYDDTKKAVEKGTQGVVFKAGAAAIAGGVAYLSAGSFAPAAWLFYSAAEGALKTTTLDSDQYLAVMGTALSVMDLARANMDASYNGGTVYDKVNGVETSYTTTGYLKQYEKYIKTCAAHGLARKDNNGNVESTPVNETDLDTQVNMHNVTRGWYHAGVSIPSRDHVITKRYRPSGVPDDFEKKYRCEGRGSCIEKFRTPWEALDDHRSKCGTGMDIDKEVVADFPSAEGHIILATIGIRLKKRTVEQGCGRYYYKCDSGKEAEHQPRTCQKWVYTYDSQFSSRYQKTRCRQGYRNCMGKTRDHNPRVIIGRFTHSDVSPDDAEDESADAGDDTDNTDDSSSTSTIVCSIQGCTLTEAYDPSDAAAAALHEYCSECYQYKCDGKDHSQTYCYNTDENGATCTVGNYYACVTHTCVYPAPTISCGRSACTQTVSSSTQHSATCASGHSYWTCNSYDVGLHRTRTCRKCSKSWERCSTPGGTPLCDDPWRRSRGLPCWKKE